MSTLSPKHQQYLAMTDDVQPVPLPEEQGNSENVAELMRFIQSQGSSQGPQQSNGAREMIRAGQRRIRLALRHRRGGDLRTKADDTSRQVLALQQEGYLPAPTNKRSSHKKSLDSGGSISRSFTNLSFKSNSRRDVESIGQPWLGDPLEDREAPSSKGSQYSSLDLRELTQLVEAAVSFSPNFEEINPPPYEPPSEWNNPREAEPTPKQSSVTICLSSVESGESGSPYSNQTGSASPCNTPGSDSQGERVRTASPLEPDEVRVDKAPNDKHDKCNSSHPGETKEKITAASKSAKSNVSPHPSNPPTPVLKLFPDTMPPRVSSKGALRIANCRSPAPNRPLPAAPNNRQQNTLPLTTDTGSRDSKSFPIKILKTLDKSRNLSNSAQSAPARPPEPSKESPGSPIYEKFPQVKNTRRPSSLPLGTIDAFPLPAPMRPLPSLPEPVPQTNAGSSDGGDTAPKPTLQAHATPPKLDPPFNSRSDNDDSKTTSPANNNCSSPARDTPSCRLVLGARGPIVNHSDSRQEDSPNQTRRALVRAGKSRAERVHSLKMKDLSASRLYLNGPKTPNIEEQFPEDQKAPQTALSDKSDSAPVDSDRRYQRKIASGPLSPPPSNPPRHPITGSTASRRYCNSSNTSGSLGVESKESASRPTSKRNSQVYRSGSMRSTGPKSERLNPEPKLGHRSETPLPSSDDEGTAGGTHRSHPPRMASGRRRRAKPAPIIVDEPPHRGRSLRKYQSSGAITPLTPQGYKRRDQEKLIIPQHSPNVYNVDEPHGHHQESKSKNSLEGRIEHLERQNKILQAALLAALDVGVKQDLSGMLGASATSLSTNATPPLTGRSCSSTTNTSSSEEQTHGRERHTRRTKTSYRPESWIASPDSFGRDSYVSDDSTNVRELEDMIEEFDLDWMSDKSSPRRNQESRIRF